MPQKKNPDIAELARGKTGRVYGSLMAMLTTMKALPLAYNRDLQEDKEGLFDTVDTLLSTLEVFTGMTNTIKINTGRMRQVLDQGYILATDLADYLVGKGESFRKAHEVVGKLVSFAIEKDKLFPEISLEEYKDFSPLFDEDVYSITIETSIDARGVVGGTSQKQVDEALKAARKKVEDSRVDR
jgi:argininosuccinate lyase